MVKNNYELSKNHCIEKSNALNEIKSTNMTLTEVRFLAIYQSKINARNPSTRLVKFQLSEFIRIMEIKSKVNISVIKERTNSLLSKIVNIPTERGGYTAFQLFKECTVDQSDDGEWFVEIDAHDKALPLMFEMKANYFKYQLWNALRLKSTNQIRMYEILKQYEKVGNRTILIEDLRCYLGIGKNEYTRFGNFNQKVLIACQDALAVYTDICYTYEPIKKAKGKIVAIKFTIMKNENYVDQLSLSEFIELQDDDSEIDYIKSDEPKDEIGEERDFSFFLDAFKNEFSIEQVQELYLLSVPFVEKQNNPKGFNIAMYDYMLLKFSQLNAKKNINHRYGYLKALIKVDIGGGINE